MTDLATALLPVLHRPTDARFNVFDVMHHGTHEKQMSNVFAWLLDSQASHHLGDAFLRIFVDEVNTGLAARAPFTPEAYLVLQEVNTSAAGDREDIADIVLENDDAVIVVENYFTSDGHGHSYCGYLRYGQRDGRRAAVVLLCHDHDSALQTDGWEHASVVTYGRLIGRLHRALESDHRYQRKHPESYTFIDQMDRKFVTGRGPMEDRQVLDFVVAMCGTGEAGRYGERPNDSAAERFANDVAEQARARFGEGRELLARVKSRLRNFSAEVLKGQLDETFDAGFIKDITANYAGVYQWTVNFDVADGDAGFAEHPLALKFGPSAWLANERDPTWKRRVDPGVADYGRLFLTRAWTREIRQSAVTLQEVLAGLAPEDRRLHDEIVGLLEGTDYPA